MLDFFRSKKKKPQKEKPVNLTPGTSQVKNIIAVASGKGGVGKSTVSTNLAIALSQQGHQVGLLDGDIYGPSQSALMGQKDQPKAHQGAMLPLEQHGIKFISVGNLNPKGGAVVMRAPMAVKAISQFLSGVIWGELDYLIVDLPPGTGDIQLSFAQQAQLKGAVIVTTPQKMALDISAKGLDLFKNVNVPILGIIENMSGFECGHCGKTTHIFSSGGGEKLSQDKGVPFLGHIPLDAHVMASADDGEPIVQKFQDSTPAQSFIQMAKNLHQELEKSQSAASKLEPENIEIYEDNGSLKINWKDNTSFEYPAFALRLDCPCASCVDEATGVRTLKEEDIDLNIKVLGARPVGRYGLALQFSDGHGTGIYRFNRLREFMEKESQEVNL